MKYIKQTPYFVSAAMLHNKWLSLNVRKYLFNFITIIFLFLLSINSSYAQIGDKAIPPKPKPRKPQPRVEKNNDDNTNSAPSRNSSNAAISRNVAVDSLPIQRRRYALVIGVDKYENPSINPLGGAANDAKAMYLALRAYASFPTENIILLSSDQPSDRQPNRKNIIRWIDTLSKNAAEDGMLFISFSGHGVEVNKRAFLLASDSELSESETAMRATGVEVSEITGIIQERGTQQVMIVLDACRNDPRANSRASDNPLTDSYIKGLDFYSKNKGVKAFAIFYATSPGQRSYEDPEKKRGYFSTAIIEGLRGGATNEKGEVTISGLESYVKYRVRELMANRSETQIPKVFSTGYPTSLVVSYVANKEANGNAAIARDVSSADFLKDGQDALDKGDFPKAIEAYQFALTLGANSIASIGLGKAYIGQGNFSEALKILNEVDSAQPDNADVNYLVGIAYLKTGKNDEAIVALEKAYKFSATTETIVFKKNKKSEIRQLKAKKN